ncbi:hypothetical protein, partial [Streptomyces sp. NPDC058758]|uniref:hypothetical protein n=1 Tax=Streptomyces sp. NPDC058758 TaxID=3346627 RepID=UPI003674410A
MSALAVVGLDAEERRYAADLIEDDRRRRILRGAEDWAEQQAAAGRMVPAEFEGWTEENWEGGDYAAACTAWLRATGRAADPSVAWAVSGPVDRVQQAGVRLEIAERALEAARSAHARAQLSMSREGIQRARERLDAAHVAVAGAAREHAAEAAVSPEGGAVVGAGEGVLSDGAEDWARGRADRADRAAAGRVTPGGVAGSRARFRRWGRVTGACVTAHVTGLCDRPGHILVLA